MQLLDGVVSLFQFEFIAFNDVLELAMDLHVHFYLMFVFSQDVFDSRVLFYADFAAVQQVSRSRPLYLVIFSMFCMSLSYMFFIIPKTSSKVSASDLSLSNQLRYF